MGGLVKSLFGGGAEPQGPSDAEKAMQRDRYESANRAEAEEDGKVALATRATSLRRSLAFRDDSKKGQLGG